MQGFPVTRPSCDFVWEQGNMGENTTGGRQEKKKGGGGCLSKKSASITDSGVS